MLAVGVRELSKHQCAFCLIVAFAIVRFMSLSCCSSVKTRIRLVKLYQFGYKEVTCICKFDCCFCSAIPFGNFTGTYLPRTPEKCLLHQFCFLLCCLWCELHCFLCYLSNDDGMILKWLGGGGLSNNMHIEVRCFIHSAT